VTDFDTTTYPLSEETSFDIGLGGDVDIMDDGTPRYRMFSSDTFATLSCVFKPMDSTVSASFYTYLISVRSTELDITHNGTTYRGYIDSKTPRKQVQGPWYYWSFAFTATVI